MELRCPHRMFGTLEPSPPVGYVTVSCPSRWCGRRDGVVVLHRFDTSTGELVSTDRFKEPPRRRRNQ